MNIHPKTALVLRVAQESLNFNDLEQKVPHGQLREIITQLLDAHDSSTERARARKSSRRWTPEEQKTLRRRWRDGWSIRQIAEEVDRSPRAVEHQLVVSGDLDRGAIRNPLAPDVGPVPDSRSGNVMDDDEDDED